MRDYLKRLVIEKSKYSLVFSNSFFYLPEKAILPALEHCAKITDRIYFEPEAWPDPRVKIQKPYEWWQNKFGQAGFIGHEEHQYLWCS